MSLRKAKQLLQQKKAQQLKKQIIQQLQDHQQQQKPTFTTKKNAFSFQNFNDEQSQEQNQEDKKDEQQKNKKQKTNSQEQQKKRKKKKKNKKKTTQQEQLQKVLKQFVMDKKQQQQQKNILPKAWQNIFQINQNKFNYQKQIRKHFKNYQQQRPQNDAELDRRQQKMQKNLRKLMKKSILSPGIKQYFPINQKFEIQRTQNDKIKFVPSKKYQSYQFEYQMIRNSNDINALFIFTQTHPEHVDSLYYVGQFLRLQGNYKDADNLIQKVIYIYQMAASYDIIQFIKQNVIKKQIIYDIYSTSFFMAMFKFMDILGKKGCFRTALQYNKFLLKLNINDPSACLLALDYNAISANQSQFLIDFITYFSHYIGKNNTSLYYLPNFIYSFALAKFTLLNKPDKNQSQMLIQETNITDLILFSEQDWKNALKMPSNQSFMKENSQTLILRAIILYPKLILEIANKNQYSKQFLNHPKFQDNQKKTFKQILQHQFWDIAPSSYSYYFLNLQNQNDSRGLDKVLQVYVQRSKILWKSNHVMLWIKGALGFILNQLDQGKLQYQTFLQKMCTEQCGGIMIPFNLSRYQNVSKSNFSDRVDRIDLNNIQDNQQINQNRQNQQDRNRMGIEGNPIRLFLNSLLPWVNLPSNNDPDQPQIQEDY